MSRPRTSRPTSSSVPQVSRASRGRAHILHDPPRRRPFLRFALCDYAGDVIGDLIKVNRPADARRGRAFAIAVMASCLALAWFTSTGGPATLRLPGWPVSFQLPSGFHGVGVEDLGLGETIAFERTGTWGKVRIVAILSKASEFGSVRAVQNQLVLKLGGGTGGMLTLLMTNPQHRMIGPFEAEEVVLETRKDTLVIRSFASADHMSIYTLALIGPSQKNGFQAIYDEFDTMCRNERP